MLYLITLLFLIFIEIYLMLFYKRKITNKQILDKIDNLQLTSVKNLLTKLGFIQVVEEDFKCKYGCNYTGKNKASLGAHYRNCKFNPSNQVKVK